MTRGLPVLRQAKLAVVVAMTVVRVVQVVPGQVIHVETIPVIILSSNKFAPASAAGAKKIALGRSRIDCERVAGRRASPFSTLKAI